MTSAADDVPADLRTTVWHFIDYGLLKRELGGSDELIDVFEKARRRYSVGADEEMASTELLDDVSAAFGDLVRREGAAVKQMADGFAPATSSETDASGVLIEAKDSMPQLTR